MPIFDYKCKSCGYEEELIVKTNYKTLNCPKCLGLATLERQVSATPYFKFDGKGTYHKGFKKHGG